MPSTVIDMNESKLRDVEQLRAFLAGTAAVRFQPAAEDAQRYAHIVAVLDRLGYSRLRRADKSVVLRYLKHLTGYSRQQLTRLVHRWVRKGALAKRYRAPRAGFARVYTSADVALLAEIDTLHGTLSGPATVHLMQRALTRFGDQRYARLASISVAHLYNLRKQQGYLARRQQWTKTRPTSVSVGVRRAPEPSGRAGYIRIDSVHQGDRDAVKGLYHINAVDCVTQWQIVASCEKLSEAYLLPVIEVLLAQFPFVVNAQAIWDNEAAARLNAARQKLFQSINRRLKRAA
jgi:hypothetical protein